MKTVLLLAFLFLSTWLNAMMPKQDVPTCVLLCNESVEKMQACVINDSICFLFTPDVSPFAVIEPSKMKRIKVASLENKSVKEKMEMYSKRYCDRITGVFFVELKEGYQLPNSLFKNRVIESVDK
jgi:hypothetical protein